MTEDFTLAYADFLLKNYRFLCEKQRNTAKTYAALLEWEICAVEDALLDLSEFERSVVCAAYIDGEKWQDVMDKKYVSHTTISRFRKKATAAIAQRISERYSEL